MTGNPNERDPIEWAQHSALVAISAARLLLDVLEGVVSDRERLERLAGAGRAAAGPWLADFAHAMGSIVPLGSTASRPATEPGSERRTPVAPMPAKRAVKKAGPRAKKSGTTSARKPAPRRSTDSERVRRAGRAGSA
jgi:hypothetical protein